MPACFPDCTSVFIRLCLAIFIICNISLLYIYNSRALEIRPNKKPMNREIKYVLQWSGKTLAPFNYMGEGNSAFIKYNCKYTNCYVTDNASYIKLTDFDAIAFNGRKVIYMKPSQLPQSRSPKQKYVFGATESAHRFPACNKVLDNFFNWTWTYKLSSDFRFGYITIYDLQGNEVGPAINMKWPENMDPIGEDLKAKLSSKSKAAAWFVSHCRTHSKREDIVSKVNKESKKFGWNVDIYGSCGKLKCPRSNWTECAKNVENEYYFYFAFENSFAEDYVTEKLLTALNNYAVPVVFGAANYSRFLPPGSYLDAMKLGPANLTREMNAVITNKERYYEFFKWRNHFTYNLTLEDTDICKLCYFLNDDQKVNTVSEWKNFRRWWNGADISQTVEDICYKIELQDLTRTYIHCKLNKACKNDITMSLCNCATDHHCVTTDICAIETTESTDGISNLRCFFQMLLLIYFNNKIKTWLNVLFKRL